MSGGSFNYLCGASDVEDLLHKRAELSDMVDFLAARGYAKDAAVASASLLARIRQLEVWVEAEIGRLRPVWKAAEWWQSCDWSEDQFKQALAEYRQVQPVAGRRCAGRVANEGGEFPCVLTRSPSRSMPQRVRRRLAPVTEIVYFARCPEHGLHGCRTNCFECGEEAEQVPMVALADYERLRDALRLLADRDNWQGDPFSHDAVLLGHFTPHELARVTLARA